MRPRIVTLLTDFGTADAYAGILKGVVLGICPEAQLVDLTHEVGPQDIMAGALLLRSAARFFPAGTIHVAVVDPGVGSARKPILVQAGGASFIGPDNGLLHPAASERGIHRIIALTRPNFHLSRVGKTFHGRDVFAPVAGHLARGVAAEDLGPVLKEMQALELPAAKREGDLLRGEVVHVDRYGNLVTNVTRADLDGFRGATLCVSIVGCDAIPLLESYSDAPAGELLALVASWDQVEVAQRDGSAAARLGVGVGAAVQVGSV